MNRNTTQNEMGKAQRDLELAATKLRNAQVAHQKATTALEAAHEAHANAWVAFNQRFNVVRSGAMVPPAGMK